MAVAILKQSPSKTPRSMIFPFFQRVAWNELSFVVFAPPTTSPASLSHRITLVLPPSVPRSVITPWLHRKACRKEFPAKVEAPATCPWLLAQEMQSKGPHTSVPPSVPRSIIVPLFHRKGCAVGMPVSRFGVESTNENPLTNPLRSLLQLAPGSASGPPSVPKSRILPSCQMKG